MKRKIFLLPAIFILVILFLSACGRGSRDVENENGGLQNGGVDYHEEIRHGFTAETLTIFTPFRDLPSIQRAADAFTGNMARQGTILHFDIVSYTMEERQEHLDLLLAKFAAGTGPDIFVRDFHLLYPFVENNFIADIYNLIDEPENFSREDFFTNFLDKIAIDGNLYMLPVSFGIDYIGINANVPQQFLNRFAELDRAAPSNITSLYLDLIDEYPQWAEFALIHNFNPNQAFAPEINNAINFANHGTNFAIDTNLLENIRLAFENNQRFGALTVNWNNAENYLATKQERYVFSRVTGMHSGIYGLFQFRDPLFAYYIPLADENGNLINRTMVVEMVANRNANPDLAIGFMTQLVTEAATEHFIFGQDIPILRRYFQQSVETGFRRTLDHGMTLPPLLNTESFSIELAVNRMREYSTWNITMPVVNYFMPSAVAMETFSQFLTSDMPANEAISQIENSITVWLNQEPEEIVPFEYIPSEEDYEDLPPRILTVRTNDRHTEVILQAAGAMNRTWRQRNEPYSFRVEVEDHNWMDWQGQEGRRARLQTELMAGLGPDMFIFENHNIHALAHSGFLQNFYTLMDECPNTNRDDFFTQALQAFEINNGLYFFPTSFGFEYIGINASLPQEFINRFAQKSTINYTDMMEIYIDLMDEHWSEFGHLGFQTGDGRTHPIGTLRNAMYGFIDFNARTSNLTDPRFIDFLELHRKAYANWNEEESFIGTPLDTPGALGERAQESVFRAQSKLLNPFYAFFTKTTPAFVHHIPLVDFNGRLLLDLPGNDISPVWSAICVTAVADGAMAWELARHILYAYVSPGERAITSPVTGTLAGWGDYSFATPIKRSLAENRALRLFQRTFSMFNMLGWQVFEDLDTPEERSLQFETAVNRIAAYNEQPMSTRTPLVPVHLFDEPFFQFIDGIISPETLAQRLHNSISLWLIE
jgi:maltose-binding protein MalE